MLVFCNSDWLKNLNNQSKCLKNKRGVNFFIGLAQASIAQVIVNFLAIYLIDHSRPFIVFLLEK